MNNSPNKKVIVTGAGRGIGRSISIAFAKDGYDVALISRTASELESVAIEIEKYGRKAIILSAEISNETHIKKAVDEVLIKFGKVDTLVNNAGIGIFAKVVDLKTEDFDKMFSVNMRGLFLTTKKVGCNWFCEKLNVGSKRIQLFQQN